MATNRQIKLPTSGSSTYTNLTPMPTEFGGYAIGTTFDGVSISDVLDGLLYPYQVPTFGSFSIYGQTITLECGVAVSGSTRNDWIELFDYLERTYEDVISYYDNGNPEVYPNVAMLPKSCRQVNHPLDI